MRILIDTHEKLASALQKNIPEIDFVLIFGSAAGGALKKSSDIDVGVYLNTPATEDLILEIVETVESIMHAECDLSILNDASEILRPEPLLSGGSHPKHRGVGTYPECAALPE